LPGHAFTPAALTLLGAVFGLGGCAYHPGPNAIERRSKIWNSQPQAVAGGPVTLTIVQVDEVKSGGYYLTRAAYMIDDTVVHHRWDRTTPPITLALTPGPHRLTVAYEFFGSAELTGETFYVELAHDFQCLGGTTLVLSYRTFEKGWFLLDPTDSLGIELHRAEEFAPKSAEALDVKLSQGDCWVHPVPAR